MPPLRFMPLTRKVAFPRGTTAVHGSITSLSMTGSLGDPGWSGPSATAGGGLAASVDTSSSLIARTGLKSVNPTTIATSALTLFNRSSRPLRSFHSALLLHRPSILPAASARRAPSYNPDSHETSSHPHSSHPTCLPHGLHPDRVARRDRDHRGPHRAAPSSRSKGARSRRPHDLLQQPSRDCRGR